jgi:RND family efflux transporter MFP subunit
VNDDRVAHVCPPVEGVVRDVPVRLGEDVARGQVLAVIDSKEVGQAKLDLVIARATLEAERAREAWARTTAANAEDLIRAVENEQPVADIEKAFKDRPVGERRQALLAAFTHRNQVRSLLAGQRDSAGSVSPSTLRKTESDAEAAEAALQALCEEFKFQARQQSKLAELKRKETEAAFDVARGKLLMLGFTDDQIQGINPIAEGPSASLYEVKAPFAGTVVDKHAVRSERVNPQFQMFQLADLSSVWIQADAFEADLPLLRGLGKRGVLFRAPGAGVGERTAEVFYTGDLMDKVSRAVTVTTTAANPDRCLKPGMYVEVGLPRGEAHPVLTLPATAVQRDQGKAFVFVHDGGDQFRRVDVEVGRDTGDHVEIKGGLAAGQVVAVAGGFVLKSELLRDQIMGE